MAVLLGELAEEESDLKIVGVEKTSAIILYTEIVPNRCNRNSKS